MSALKATTTRLRDGGRLERHGLWAIGRRERARCPVHHLPSGVTVAEFPSTAAARSFIAAVSGLTDWRAPTPAADPAIRAALEAAIARHAGRTAAA